VAAAPPLADALRFAHEAGLRPVVPDCLDALAAVALAAGHADTAARLLGAAGAFRELLGTVAWPAEAHRAARTLAAARDALGGTRFATAHGAGRALGWGEAVALAFVAADGAA
jgi:hypothetical protein